MKHAPQLTPPVQINKLAPPPAHINSLHHPIDATLFMLHDPTISNPQPGPLFPILPYAVEESMLASRARSWTSVSLSLASGA